jgi:pyruvate-formate lyase-activating enzyme
MPDIPFWNKCNNKCVMCTNAPGFARQPGVNYRLKSQISKLERYLKGLGPIYLKNAGSADFVSLTGGEPTLHPEFFQLLAYFRRRLPGTPITLLSNGRRFADAGFSEKFAAAARAPFTVAVALHGPSARVHDAVAGVAGSFKETVQGLKNLAALAPEVRLEIRLVLHKKSIEHFPGTLEFLLKTFPDTSRYLVAAIHYEIEGMSLSNHPAVGLRLAESGKVVNAALPLIGRFMDFRLYHFPLCQVRKELRPLCWITIPEEDRVYPQEKCGACAARKKCLGLMLEYSRMFGNEELKPVKR